MVFIWSNSSVNERKRAFAIFRVSDLTFRASNPTFRVLNPSRDENGVVANT